MRRPPGLHRGPTVEREKCQQPQWASTRRPRTIPDTLHSDTCDSRVSTSVTTPTPPHIAVQHTEPSSADPPVRQQSSPVLQPASPGRAEPRAVASLERTAECRAWRRRGPSAELGPGVRPAQPARRAAAGSEAAAAGQQREECPGQAARPSPTVTTQQTPW